MTDLLPRRPLRTSESPLERLPEGAVVAPGASDRPVALNPTALALWELCDGRTDVAEMVDAVCVLFEVEPEQARADVEAALADMVAVGVVR